MDNNSIPRIPPPTYEENADWLKEVTFASNKGIVEAVESMEERVFSASMQVKVMAQKDWLFSQFCVLADSCKDVFLLQLETLVTIGHFSV